MSLRLLPCLMVPILLAGLGSPAAAVEYREVALVPLRLTRADGAVLPAWQVFARGDSRSGGFAGWAGGKELYASVPLPELYSLEIVSPEAVEISTARGVIVLPPLTYLFSPEGMKTITGFANDLSCPGDTVGAVIWVRDQDRRAILPRHLGEIRRIEWIPKLYDRVKALPGVPGDLPLGKGLARIALADGSEFQSFNPDLGEKELRQILPLLPTVPGGLEESYPLIWPPRGSDIPRQDEYLRFAQMNAGMFSRSITRLRESELPSSFLPLKEALIEFFARKGRFDRALLAYAADPDLPRFAAEVRGIFPDEVVAQALEDMKEERTTVGVLDLMDRKLYTHISRAYLIHGRPGLVAVDLLRRERLTVVSDPRINPCPAPAPVRP